MNLKKILALIALNEIDESAKVIVRLGDKEYEVESVSKKRINGIMRPILDLKEDEEDLED